MEIIVLLILICINGFFALSEIALVSAKPSRLEQAKANGSSGARIALHMLQDSEGFLSAIQVGITLIGIVTGVYGGMNLADDVAPFIALIPALQPYASQFALVFTVIIITYVSIVFGELVPKTIALSNPHVIAIKVAPTIHYFSKAFYPFVKLLSWSTTLINNVIGIKKTTEQLTEAELRQMIKTASTEGVIERDQNVIHENIFYFSDKRAKHIMTHRVDVEWLDLNKPQAVLVSQLTSAQHSKLVCSKGRPDHFKGYIDVRDYYKSLQNPNPPQLEALLKEPVVVSENAMAYQVLQQLRQHNSHFCCVIDEYGGFEGIITMHDIIESIVGAIADEGGVLEPEFHIREDGSVLINGDAPIEQLVSLIDGFTIDFEEIDYATVAGFVFHSLNKMPHLGDKVYYRNYTFEVVDLDGNRIDKVLITKNLEND
jgi:putative hemolysin